MGDALLDRRVTPGDILIGLGAASAAVLAGDFHQAVSAVAAPVQHDVADALFEIRGYVIVNRQLAGIDDTHIQSGLDGVIKENRVNRFAHRGVAAEGKRHVTDTA